MYIFNMYSTQDAFFSHRMSRCARLKQRNQCNNITHWSSTNGTLLQITIVILYSVEDFVFTNSKNTLVTLAMTPSYNAAYYYTLL